MGFDEQEEDLQRLLNSNFKGALKMNKPEITKIDDAIAIVVTCCAECPYVQALSCGKKFVCNHPKQVVAKPYSDERRVEAHMINAGCILVKQLDPELHEVAAGHIENVLSKDYMYSTVHK